ncbi:hypothetical protein OQA88_4495 [Cercophora sp. LCS_1]
MRVMRRVPTLRKKWADPERSCGREIQTMRLPRSKRAWWCCGPAMEKFEKEVAPKIEDLLRNVDLGYADIYVRLYMIGGRPDNSRPVIMICCSESTVRANAEAELRNSSLSRDFPEFSIGQSALPLEQPTPARVLAGEKGRVVIDSSNSLDHQAYGASIGTSNLRSPQRSPWPSASARTLARFEPAETRGPSYRLGDSLADIEVGRSLRYPGNPDRYSTGGAVVQIKNNIYQLTVGHIAEPAAESTAPAPSTDLELCHFDGMSDEEDVAINSEDEFYDATSRGSVTPEGAGSWILEASPDESERSTSRPPSPVEGTGSSPAQSAGKLKKHEHPARRARPQATSKAVSLRSLVQNSLEGPNPGLDYALVPLGPARPHLKTVVAGIQPGQSSNRAKAPKIRAGSPIKKQETKILAVTGSGLIPGVIFPGATLFRNKSLPTFQKLYTVQLDGEVIEGDCGAAIIDESSGNLYGHIVRGCPGASVAYIVAASEVFKDLGERMGADVTLYVGTRASMPKAPVVASPERPVIPLRSQQGGRGKPSLTQPLPVYQPPPPPPFTQPPRFIEPPPPFAHPLRLSTPPSLPQSYNCLPPPLPPPFVYPPSFPPLQGAGQRLKNNKSKEQTKPVPSAKEPAASGSQTRAKPGEGSGKAVGREAEIMEMIELEAQMDREDARLRLAQKSIKFRSFLDRSDDGSSSSGSRSTEGSLASSSRRNSYTEGLPQWLAEDLPDNIRELQIALASESTAKERWMQKALELERILSRARAELKEGDAKMRALQGHVEELEMDKLRISSVNETLRERNSIIRDDIVEMRDFQRRQTPPHDSPANSLRALTPLGSEREASPNSNQLRRAPSGMPGPALRQRAYPAAQRQSQEPGMRVVIGDDPRGSASRPSERRIMRRPSAMEAVLLPEESGRNQAVVVEQERLSIVDTSDKSWRKKRISGGFQLVPVPEDDGERSDYGLIE